MKDFCTASSHLAQPQHEPDTPSFYQNLLNASQDVICALDAEGKFIFANEAAYGLWGYTPTELIGRSYIDLIVKEDRANTASILAGAKQQLKKANFEIHCTCKEGMAKRISWSAEWDSTKNLLFCTAKEARGNLQENEQSNWQVSKLHRAYKLINLSWWEYDIASQTYIASSELFNLLGLPISPDNKITAEEFLSFVHPEDVSNLQMVLAKLDEDTYVNYQHRVIKRSGERADIVHYAEVIRDQQGKAIRIEGAGLDITEQKQAEGLIRIPEEKYKLVFNQSLVPKLIFQVDNYRIVEVNNAALKLYGYNREEFLKLTIIDLRPPEDRPALYETIEKYKSQRHAVFTSLHRHMKKDGTLFYVQIEASTIELATGIHSLVVAHDMTEKLQLQQRLINEKVTAQKEVARAIIQTQEKERREIGKELHDNVNQILTTVKLYIENIKSFPEHQNAFIEKSVTLTQKAINEIRLLSKQLVSSVINDLNFKSAIMELVEHYRWLNLFEIEYLFQADEELLDKDMQLTLYRIIQEQMNNIVKHAKAALVRIAIAADGESLIVTVADNGVGFDPAILVGGMGISNIKNRAEVYKGMVTLNTAPGKGCSLVITFPGVQAGVDR